MTFLRFVNAVLMLAIGAACGLASAQTPAAAAEPGLKLAFESIDGKQSDSRISRWRPGTFFSYSYCNSGPAFAAYVVQKVTGQRFEDYVQENFFQPLRLDTVSFFLTPDVEKKLTRLYRPDGRTPYPYWHITMSSGRGERFGAGDGKLRSVLPEPRFVRRRTACARCIH